MTVLQLPARGVWLDDARGGGRALRLSPHPEAGYVVLSTWRDGTCVSTVRLEPEEAALLIGALAQALTQLPEPAAEIAAEPAPTRQAR